MQKSKIILPLSVLLFSACFWGSENYEKEINAFFFLYRDAGSNATCLGTIQYDEGYRIGDDYLCAINKIGWDNSFIIVLDSKGKYFIQDCRKLDREKTDDYKKALYGPLTLSAFNFKRDSLKVDEDLDFELDY